MRYLNYNGGDLSVSRLRHPDSRVVELETLVQAFHDQRHDRLTVGVWDNAPSVADTLTRDDFIANAELKLTAVEPVRLFAEAMGI